MNKLERIYDDAMELKKEFPDKDYSEFYVGFNPKENRVRRAVIKKSISKSYRDLHEKKKKKGGF